jgi:hypothetical protein
MGGIGRSDEQHDHLGAAGEGAPEFRPVHDPTIGDAFGTAFDARQIRPVIRFGRGACCRRP